MWVVGDWGQSSPWTRNTGAKMVKGGDGVWIGELSLPKGTKFDIKILKSTVSTTSGGDNAWSAVRYASTLNTSTSHGFGEFTDNLIPNGNFDDGKAKWTPADAITKSDKVNSAPNLLELGGVSAITSCSSDVFTIPPGQTFCLSGYINTSHPPIKGGVTMKIVAPQQQTLFECEFNGGGNGTFLQFSKTFKSTDVPMECQITLSNAVVGKWPFVALSLVSP